MQQTFLRETRRNVTLVHDPLHQVDSQSTFATFARKLFDIDFRKVPRVDHFPAVDDLDAHLGRSQVETEPDAAIGGSSVGVFEYVGGRLVDRQGDLRAVVGSSKPDAAANSRVTSRTSPSRAVSLGIESSQVGSPAPHERLASLRKLETASSSVGKIR